MIEERKILDMRNARWADPQKKAILVDINFSDIGDSDYYVPYIVAKDDCMEYGRAIWKDMMRKRKLIADYEDPCTPELKEQQELSELDWKISQLVGNTLHAKIDFIEKHRNDNPIVEKLLERYHTEQKEFMGSLFQFE